MSRDYKNILELRNRAFGKERRENLTKEALKDSTPLPKPVTYEDIDKAFYKWVDEKLEISFEGKRLPTMNLYSNQRFSEYIQSWSFVDNDKNLILNFKTISRENNPKSGTINGQTKNIPGEPTFLMKRVAARDKNDREYYIDYRMKLPFSIDLNYKVSIMTNKYELLNQFNMIVNKEFEAIYSYIYPNDHFMSMILTDISDDSEYSIDDRQFYSQSYMITVRAYIISEDSFSVHEIPKMKLVGFDFETGKSDSSVEIEDYEWWLPNDCPDNPYKPIQVKITVNMDYCCEKTKFNVDCNLGLSSIKIIGKVRSYRLFVNDTEIENIEIKRVTEKDKEYGGVFYEVPDYSVGDKYTLIDLKLKEGDEIKISGLRLPQSGIDSQFIFFGVEKSIEKVTAFRDEFGDVEIIEETEIDCL